MAFPDDGPQPDVVQQPPPTSLPVPPRSLPPIGAFDLTRLGVPPGFNLTPNFAQLGQNLPLPPGSPQGNIPRTPFPVQIQQAPGGGGGVAPAGMPPIPAAPRKIPVPEPPKPDYSDSMKAMGNPLALLAMIASTFVRNPGIAAGNAMAAAMQAQKENDQVRYNNAYKEYTQKIQQVAREQQQENDEYNALFNNAKLTYDQKLAAVRGHAAKRGDGLALTALQGGNLDDQQFRKLIEARSKTVGQIKAFTEADELAKREGIPFKEAYTRSQGKGAGKTQGALGDLSLEGKAYEESLPPEFRDYVHAVAFENAKPPNVRWGSAILASAYHLNPNLDPNAVSTRGVAQRTQVGSTMTQGRMTLNQVQGHIEDAYNAAQKLDLTDWRTANKGILSWAKETNNPAAGAFLEALTVVRNEAAAVFKGNRPTEGEINRQINVIQDSSSLSYLTAQLQQLQVLINKRLYEQAFEYGKAFGLTPEQAMPFVLNPEAKASFEKIQKVGTGGAPRISSEEEYNNLKSGDHYIDARDNQEKVKQ